MNIKEAKKEIFDSVKAYFTKNEFGEYIIPIEKQRPIFLMGPPGIGKTAIMEQVASELNVGLVSYSMTHHTRQSAIGLPFIEKKMYGGVEYNVSEYTMSEIIASVYDLMEDTGVKEGILFLDEINCVSETLAPSMLQFLQYKIFGRHRVPAGWIVVTAGNPPEYNNSVREFDIVTWDRLKRIDIEPDHDIWKEFALNNGVHPAITTYLDIKKGDFYRIESTVDGKTFATARGWSDLSDMIYLYEMNKTPVTRTLVSQYIQNPKIARNFAAYYDLFNKYKSDYQVESILNGTASDEIICRASNAKFDERLSLIGLMLDAVGNHMNTALNMEKTQIAVMGVLKKVKAGLREPVDTVTADISAAIEQKREELNNGRKAGTLSSGDQYILNNTISVLQRHIELVKSSGAASSKDAFAVIKKSFDKDTKALKAKADEASKKLSNMFKFSEIVFQSGNELLIIVTELTINNNASVFINKYGCKEYFAHNKELMFHERQLEIINSLEELDL